MKMKMSRKEELLYSAEEHGVRYKMFDEIKKLRMLYPELSLDDVYEKAYQNIMNT